MATFLLIHGSWHGAWCWRRLTPLLEASGNRVLAVDLPAHGVDQTLARKATLDGYARAIELMAQQSSEPPILVAHSMGGMPATLAAARSPQLFSALIYIAAFVPLRNDSLFKLFGADRGSKLRAAVRPGLFTLKVAPDDARAIFYGQCDEEDVRAAITCLRPDPLRPMWARLGIEPNVVLPRYYVECTRDQAISIDAQRAMCLRAGIQHIISMDTDHSPFLSRSAALAGHLCQLAQESSVGQSVL
jgi:pimeloyl-ACP methyl ester carboxylesterase